MRNWIKMMLGLVLALGVQGLTAQIAVDTAALSNAYEDLAELRAVDKSSLTKLEKRAWRVEKRAAKSVIAREESKIQFLQDMNNAWRFGYANPYGFYNTGAWGFGYHPWAFRRAYRPVVVVRRPAARVRVRR